MNTLAIIFVIWCICNSFKRREEVQEERHQEILKTLQGDEYIEPEKEKTWVENFTEYLEKNRESIESKKIRLNTLKNEKDEMTNKITTLKEEFEGEWEEEKHEEN